jgi:hypothetical protein
MNEDKSILVSVFSRRSMRNPEDFFKRIQLHSTMLSQIAPTKWGWWEPLRKKWELKDLNKFIPNDRNGAADTVSWVRDKEPKMFGHFGVAFKSGVDYLMSTHAKEEIEYASEKIDESHTISYIKQSSILLDCDLAYIHTVSDQEKESRTLESRYGAPCIIDKVLKTSTHTLRHWLPDLPWGTVFGSAYVKMFGLQTLLTAPAYQIEKLSDEVVYIQLSPKLSDMVNDYENVNLVREAVKNHLGRDAFFEVSKAYPLRGPLMPCTPQEAIAFKHPSPIGTVFKVPDFQLIDDEYMQRA